MVISATRDERVRSTHCARRPPCVIVTMILSANWIEVISVGTPSIKPAVCLVIAG